MIRKQPPHPNNSHAMNEVCMQYRLFPKDTEVLKFDVIFPCRIIILKHDLQLSLLFYDVITKYKSFHVFRVMGC